MDKAKQTAISSLTNLPSELRCYVWEYALTFDPVNFAHEHQSNTPVTRSETLGLSLLLASRQIYQETRLLPFELNTFVFSLSSLRETQPGIPLARCRALLSSLQPFQLSSIRSLTLHVTEANLFGKGHRYGLIHVCRLMQPSLEKLELVVWDATVTHPDWLLGGGVLSQNEELRNQVPWIKYIPATEQYMLSGQPEWMKQGIWTLRKLKELIVHFRWACSEATSAGAKGVQDIVGVVMGEGMATGTIVRTEASYEC